MGAILNEIEDVLMHYGMPRRSGRYPWGSGENPYQHSGDFLSRVYELRKQNFTYTDEDGKLWTGDTAIAKSMGLTSSQLRTQMSLAKDERRSLQVATAKGLREKGYSLNEIAEKMGFANDSSVRSLLNENAEARMNKARNVADILRNELETKKMIDVGAGVERELGVSREKLEEALYILQMEGYPVYGGGVAQATNKGKQTNLKVLCQPGTEHKEMYEYGEIQSLIDYTSDDGGETFRKAFQYPESMDSGRLQIRYAEDGGVNKDGVIELRRGVSDLSLGESNYAQVRILVDGNRYIKGMAVYGDDADFPPGVDVIFNTNKKSGVPKMDVLKPISDDPDNPFGSLIKEHGGQSTYIDKDGKERLSLINKRAEEGDWGDWSDNLPSQFLSKQSMPLIKKQLNLAAADREAEFNEICALTNPTVKKRLLQSFADDCDAAAVHLKAAALPRQKYQVILPLTSVKDAEVYAPNYHDGETVALIRYPHGGTFEIPILKVNNKLPEGQRVLGKTPADAIGINKKVADRLSGADFDGDTVMVIPCNSSRSNVKITSTPPLRGLEGFDPKDKYQYDTKTMDSAGNVHYYRNGVEFKAMRNTQTEMGKISNLITDMTLKGARQDEIARAVRHSMVVIDAEKHGLDYKRSAQENGISALKKSYQYRVDEDGTVHDGASTLISRASSEKSVPKRRGSPQIDPETGEQSWKLARDSDRFYTVEKVNKRTGEVKTVQKERTQQSTQMAETRDARRLSSGTKQEEAYADYANRMKALGNKARKEMVSTGRIKYDASAKAVYKKEVDSLNAKLNVSLKNAPRERQAQTMANATMKAKKQEYPDMTKAEEKKASQQALTASRLKVGAQRSPIKITDREWEAIQAGAITENQLSKILNNADIDDIRKRATPRATTQLSQSKINLISSLKASGYTTSQIAARLGISSSTVTKYLNGKG